MTDSGIDVIDAIFTAGSLVFIIGLLPAVFNPETRISAKTSASTAIVLFVYAVTFAYMGLAWSAGTSFILCLLWTLILVERSP